MFLADVDADASARAVNSSRSLSRPALAGGAALKAALAALAGFVLCLGIALVVWAVTPSSGDSPTTLVRAGLAAFCGAAGMTLRIGNTDLTLPPLMLTAVIIALLLAVIGRGRRPERDVEDELTVVGAATASFAATVTVVGVLFSGHAVSGAQWWRPAFLAAVVFGVAMLVRGSACREWLFDRLPPWVPVSLRVGSAGIFALFGGGAVTLIVGLIRTFSDSSTIQTLAAPGAAGGFGMFLLGLAYLPNAAIAATGYSTGVGFTVGSGTYTPFGSTPVELPAVSLLTAVPDSHTVGRTALLVLLVPVVAGLVIGLGSIRRLAARSDRLFAVGAASLFAAVVAALVAEMASGGVQGGEWSSSGPPPVLFGAAVGVVLGAVGAAVASVAPAHVIAASDDRDEEFDEPDQVDEVDESEVDDGQEVDVDGQEVGVVEEDIDDESAEEDIDEHPTEVVAVADGINENGIDENATDEPVDESPTAGNPTAGNPTDEVGREDTSARDPDEPAATAETAPRARRAAEIPAPRDEDVIAGASEDADVALVTELRPRRRPGRAG